MNSFLNGIIWTHLSYPDITSEKKMSDDDQFNWPISRV